jgi:hypothetical protein
VTEIEVPTPKLPEPAAKDPGPAPWCPECGASASRHLAVPQGPGFPNNKKMGVCTSCGGVRQPDFSVTGEMLPFLRAISDLREHPAQIASVARQVRDKLAAARSG